MILRTQHNITEFSTLVDVDVVDAEFVEDQAVVFFLFGEEFFQSFLALRFLLLAGLDYVAVYAARVGGSAVAEELVVCRDLLTQKLLLILPRHPDALEGTVGDDDAVPGAARDFRREKLAPLTGKILLACNQEPSVWIELHKLSAKLL